MCGSDVFTTDLSMLSDDEYSRVASMCEQSFQRLLSRGIVPLVPALIREQHLRMRRTELGSGPVSLLSALGLYDRVIDAILPSLVPRCPACSTVASPPCSLDLHSVPSDGVLGISVVCGENEYGLRERCELLGVERAYVNGHVRSISEVRDETGEALLLVASVRDSDVVQDEIARWFARGGGDLRLIHFSSRTAHGLEIGVLNHSWICESCQRSLMQPSRSNLLSAPACKSCAGDGWIESPELQDDRRFIACRDCDGIGFVSDFSGYDFFGTPLGRIMTLQFSEVRRLMLEKVGAEEVANLLDTVCKSGFADYPIGSCYTLFSAGERTLAMLASCRLAQLQDVRFVVDGAYGDFKGVSSDLCDANNHLLVATTCMSVRERPANATRMENTIVLRDVHVGPLHVPLIEFPLGAVSAVQGGVGTGKTLLLKVMQQRFAKRRSQMDRATFGPIQRCSVIHGIIDQRRTVLHGIGFEQVLAEEISRTRQAKQYGILVDDLDLSCSKYRCAVCEGRGVQSDGERCTECEGLLYDWRVVDLPLLGSSVREIMQRPINSLGELLWFQPGIETVCDAIHEIGAGGVTLSTPLGELDPALRRTLSVVSRLAAIPGQRLSTRKQAHSELSKDLILIDGPCIVPSQHGDIIRKLLQNAEAKGATVVYASMPESLESICASVLRLDRQTQDAPQHIRERYLDARYARRSSSAC